MRILFIGDIVGQPGRQAVRELLPRLRREHQVHLVIANGENMAGGSGITGRTAEEMLAAGVDVLTSGDHIWDHKEINAVLDREQRVLRPLNYPPGTPGNGSIVVTVDGQPDTAIINLQGRTFMAPMEHPFLEVEREVARLRCRARVIFVDFHAEATSEKIALGRMLDGQVSAVVGTHTHVQTADEQIFPGGTAYLTDAGFTGPHDSVIGREIEPVLRRFRTGLPQRFEVASGRVRLQGALIDVDGATGRATAIQRISEPLDASLPG
ncbi:MAG: TIGR00282 family metallophosphoesterase [Verrucomicrobiales bacterium]|nr:TIGR00282 family metallophosphoesterase [Verrucomicrobiales bacterium]